MSSVNLKLGTFEHINCNKTFNFFLCRFSVNFCLETNPNPTYIAYHFKTIFETNIVVQNFKTAGEWSEEIIEENTWYNVPGK